jgi:hypothetical protein
VACVSKKIEKRRRGTGLAEKRECRTYQPGDQKVSGITEGTQRCILGAEYHLKRVGTQTSCPGVLQNGDVVCRSLFGKWVDLLRLRQSVP